MSCMRKIMLCLLLAHLTDRDKVTALKVGSTAIFYKDW